ncbi:MAG: ATP synthase F1 subunit delta [Deferribacteres bacterium]|nr:ATP synthase F1 subunit delta [candidate division KSB1 bacterium]MCB9502981.1 ATP synthase F1 subunit delta [Deferribacteres bacterium]
MKAVVLARRYAKALFELAKEKKVIDQVAADVNSFNATISQNSEIRHFLFSPEREIKEKIEVFERALVKACSPLFNRFLAFLLEKRRQHIFSEIATEFNVLYDSHANKIRGVVISAKQINKAEMKNLNNALAKQFNATVDLQNEVEEAIIGGLILKVGGKIYDNSLRSHVKQLERRLLAEA